MSASGVLMTETLPTIIGAGVVSKTTDTMFGKNRRRATNRRAKSRIGGRAVHTGKRGGKYIIKNGRRIYI